MRCISLRLRLVDMSYVQSSIQLSKLKEEANPGRDGSVPAAWYKEDRGRHDLNTTACVLVRVRWMGRGGYRMNNTGAVAALMT